MAVSETRVTRGRLLKRAGAGAAIGVGAMVTAGTASADLLPSTSCIDAGGCGSFQACEGGCDCGCVVTVESRCICMQNVFCEGLKGCFSSQQCPRGWACATRRLWGNAHARLLCAALRVHGTARRAVRSKHSCGTDDVLGLVGYDDIPRWWRASSEALHTFSGLASEATQA